MVPRAIESEVVMLSWATTVVSTLRFGTGVGVFRDQVVPLRHRIAELARYATS